MPPLVESDLPDRLERALTAFEADLGKALVRSAGGGSEYTRYQFVSTALDVTAGGRLLARAQRDAAAAAESWAQVMPGAETVDAWVIPTDAPDHELLGSLEVLRVAWKSWFFFVSAFCDQSYRLLLADLRGSAATRGTMSSVTKSTNPVAELLRTQAPDVLDWFIAFRRRRNVVKEGTMFSFTALASPGVGITFRTLVIAADGRTSSHADPDGELSFETVLDDVASLGGLLNVAEILESLRASS